MKFLKLEYALNILAGYGPAEGPLYNSAGSLEGILSDDKTTGEKKAELLRELIIDYRQAWQQQGYPDLGIATPKEFAQAFDKSEKTIIRMCQEGKIKNAKRVGSGKNSKWVIVLKS